MMLSIFTLWVVGIASKSAMATSDADTTSPFLRGHQHDSSHRELFPHRKKKSNSGQHYSYSSNYKGCLDYSNSDLSYSSSSSNNLPDCSWKHTSSGSSSSSGGSGSGSSSSSSSSGGSSSSSSGGSSSSSSSSNGDNAYSGSSNGGDDNDSYGNYDDAEYQVVSNEDMYGGDSDYNPIEDFDIQVCDTYENLWIWDLAISCNNVTMEDGSIAAMNGSSCSCSFAEELVSSGLLTCKDASSCPDDCSICSTCLRLLGCNVDGPPLVIQYLSRPLVMYIVGAALALLLFALIAHYSRKKWKPEGDSLNQNLLADAPAKALTSTTPQDCKQSPPPLKPGPTTYTMYISENDLSCRAQPANEGNAAAHHFHRTGTVSTASTGKQLLSSRSHSSCSDCSSNSDSTQNQEESPEDSVLPSTQQDEDTTTGDVPAIVATKSIDGTSSFALSPIRTGDDASDADEDESSPNPVFEDQSPTSTTEKLE